jgi:DNA-binding transcriptional ArsR family regulator
MKTTEGSADGMSLKRTAELFGLLASEGRLRLLSRLAAQGELHSGGLVQGMDMSQSGVSYQLMLLRRGHLVRMRRQGQCNYYSINAPLIKDLLRLVCGPDLMKGAE